MRAEGKTPFGAPNQPAADTRGRSFNCDTPPRRAFRRASVRERRRPRRPRLRRAIASNTVALFSSNSRAALVKEPASATLAKWPGLRSREGATKWSRFWVPRVFHTSILTDRGTTRCTFYKRRPTTNRSAVRRSWSKEHDRDWFHQFTAFAGPVSRNLCFERCRRCAGSTKGDIGRKPVLMVPGRFDPIVSPGAAAALARMLADAGADLDRQVVPSAYGLRRQT